MKENPKTLTPLGHKRRNIFLVVAGAIIIFILWQGNQWFSDRKEFPNKFCNSEVCVKMNPPWNFKDGCFISENKGWIYGVCSGGLYYKVNKETVEEALKVMQ